MSEVETSPVEASSPISAEQAESIEQQAAPATEEQQTEQKPEQKVDDKFASKFAALSRKEKMIREREKQAMSIQAQIEEQKKQMEAERAKWQEELSSYKSKIEGIKKNPLKSLEEEGITFEKLTEMQLNEQNPTLEMQLEKLRSELDSKYAKELESLKNQLAEKEQKQQEEVIEQAKQAYRKEIQSVLQASPEQYELTLANNAEDLVYDVVEEFYNANGKILSAEEAAQMVEKHFEDEAKRILSLKKLQQASKPKEPVEAKKESGKTTPTLSNAMSQERPVTGTRKMSAEESLREAAKLIRWEEQSATIKVALENPQPELQDEGLNKI